ncbi:tyrosine recombinase XerD [Dictyobacter sp. S3.2.2.5]|uniref:Tyrosine recombinase XerD n=1 Tax=Dictyobacter halimunensis TaxID=3026934 RepID=A0ABQ6G1H6_9CHLR|nr:tyrosine recombinase XerD [Dictyobacter sp. S3.2.2.5]
MAQPTKKPVTGKRSSSTPKQSGAVIPRRKERTIRKSIDEYIADHQSQHHSIKTVKWHQLALGHLANFLEQQGVIYIKDLEKEHLVDWINLLTEEPGSRGKLRTTRTVNYYARSMRAFCRWLEAEGYVEVAPSNRVKMPKLSKPLIRIIEFEEFERMLKACTPPREVGPTAGCNAARNRAILWVLWDTGIRLAELCGLRFSNFDRDKGVIIVHGKGNKERRIALGRNALRTLLLYMDRYRPDEDALLEIGIADEDHIFLSEGGNALTRDGISMLFKRIRARADLPHDKRISPHIFRHTFAVCFLMLGGDIFTLQELLGHEDMATIRQYMHLNDTLIQEQKRKFSPGDNVPFNGMAVGKTPRTDFRDPIKRKPGTGRGIKLAK